MVLASKEFSGSANGRRTVTKILNHLVEPPDDFCVCNVFAVPRQKIVDSVPRGNGDVTGIGSCLLRDDAAFEDTGTQLDRVVVDFEKGQAFDGIDAFAGCLRITPSDLFDDEFGDEDGIMALSGIPPAEG